MTAQTILPANSVTDTGYDVGNSIKFNGSNSVMQRNAAGTPSSTKIWSISFWVKRCRLGTTEVVWMHQNAANHTAKFQLGFHSSDTFRIETYDGTNEYNLSTDMLFRDTSAWYSILVNVDSTQGTEANRYKIFVNGIQAAVTETGSGYPAQNWDLDLGSQKIALGRYQAASPSAYYDGYVAEVVYADGQTLAPTDIGEFDSASGIFKPIDVSELTLGNAGFYINFADSSDLGATTGNDFALTNLAATDQSTDTCTNNFPTMNSLDNYYASTTFSEGNLKMVTNGSAIVYNTSTIGFSSGKWYMEVKLGSSSGEVLGVITGPATANNNDNKIGNRADGWGYDYRGLVENAGSDEGGSFAAFDSGDVIGVYADLDNDKIYFSKNGTLQNSGTGLNLDVAGSPTYFFAVGDNHGSNAATFEVNFGNPVSALSSAVSDGTYGSFEYSTTITGDSASKTFKALNTKNLAEFG